VHGRASIELRRDSRVDAPQLHLRRLKDEHFQLVGGEGERIVQPLKETHLHDAYLIGGVTEGIRNARVGDGGSVVPELHGHQGTCK